MSEHFNIYVFEKTFDERLDEYTNILSMEGKLMPGSQIHAEWSCDVEVVIERNGWQALWNISRFTCENYHICYPTIVLVEVLAINFPTLSALVKIMAVQGKLNLPEKHDVPLIELYPTIKQKNLSLDIRGTAHCIDRLRFFYNNLWMPWDEDEDDVDWVERHLESRLKLYFDIKDLINKETCDRIKSLVSEGREIKNKISQMDISSDEEEEVTEELAKKTYILIQLHFRFLQIKTEMDLLEDSTVRELYEKNRSMENKKENSDNTNKKNVHYLVWEGDTVKEFLEISNKIQSILPENISIKICEYLENVLDICQVGDTILLGKGKYPIKHSIRLPEKGTIMGICNIENTVLCAKESEILSSLFNFSGTEVLLKNLSVELENLQVGIIVEKGCTVIITDCRIYVSNPSSTKWGAIAMPDAKLIFNNTIFQGLGTAIVTYATSEVVLNKCHFEQCYEAVQLNDNVHFTATECSFEAMKSYAIVMETENVIRSGTKIGNEELFTDISKISLKDCKFDNKKSVMLKPKIFDINTKL